ncbi:hypothetical protein [Bradyrhizobium neotropicale]|uniref:hypothetical protein n=1 Tax=Bradyrhizobium neotropicale TaxID=1497615 RepID=UPI001AD6BD8D|nr:hypothetical protein [Bradyrhizobium neotropicale]MBO4222634.1 hypothetical protein [Bradyrhizobium neotropicale]
MAHLVDIQACDDPPPVLHVRVGDLLLFAATGGRVLEGGTTVELVGVFSSGVISDDGRVLSPAGPPASALFRALQSGQARIEVIRGDPWQAPPEARQIAIVVGA